MTRVFTELFIQVRHLTAIRAANRGVMAAFIVVLVWVAITLGQPLAENLARQRESRCTLC